MNTVSELISHPLTPPLLYGTLWYKILGFRYLNYSSLLSLKCMVEQYPMKQLVFTTHSENCQEKIELIKWVVIDCKSFVYRVSVTYKSDKYDSLYLCVILAPNTCFFFSILHLSTCRQGGCTMSPWGQTTSDIIFRNHGLFKGTSSIHACSWMVHFFFKMKRPCENRCQMILKNMKKFTLLPDRATYLPTQYLPTF